MENIITISNFTIREALSRKIIVTFFAISTFVIIIFALLFAFIPFEDLSGMVHAKGSDPVNIAQEIVKGLKLFVVAPLFGGGLFLSIFSASSFIPNMTEKGVVDLLISKPISREQIILGKFLGGVLIVLINIAYLIISIWILIGIKFSIWSPDLLYSIFTITFTFSSLYSLIILIGLVTQSSVLAMMLSYIIFFVISPVLVARDTINIFLDSRFMEWLMDVLYYIIPKTSELGSLTTELAIGYGIDEWQPILTTFAFTILVLYGSIIIFSKKDY
jgi:ABC-type transport system involved in multi-copper enzyme maturation permease subunit